MKRRIIYWCAEFFEMEEEEFTLQGFLEAGYCISFTLFCLLFLYLWIGAL